MVEDSTAVVSMEVGSGEAVMATGLLVMAVPTAAGLLDVGIMADTGALTADGAAYTEQAVEAASTARSGVPTRHIIVVFRERQGTQATPVFTPRIHR